MDLHIAWCFWRCIRFRQWLVHVGKFDVSFRTDVATTVLAGLLTDYSESKSFPFLLGMLTMVASSLMFFLGEHIAVTIAARALQGLSASFVWVSGLALLNSRVKANYIGTAMGYVSVATAAGELLGPIVGGTMYEHAGHFAVLGLVCGILGIDIVLRLLLTDKSSDDHEQGDADRVAEERPLLDGETGHETRKSVDAQETNKPEYANILGFRLDRDLCATYYAACVIGTVRYGFESALVVFVSQRFSWSTSASGAILFALLSPAALGPSAGYLATKYGPRWISAAAFGIATLALVALGLLTRPDTATKALFVVAVTVIGVCLACLVTVQSIAFSVAIKKREILARLEGRKESTGTAFGSFSMAWTVGMIVGPLAAEVFIDHVNWMAFCLFLAAWCAVSAALMIFSWKQWEIPDED
jgi:MFS family permease